MNLIHIALIVLLVVLGGAAAYLGYRVFRLFVEHGDKTADELPPEFKVWIHFFRIGMLLFLFAGIVAMMLW